MTFLDEQQWQGKVFDGTWRTADGGERTVIEPATGDELGAVGFAALSDLERSAIQAREAQVAWTAAPFRERAAVRRRAGELWATYTDEIKRWLIRESGGAEVRTSHELIDATAECFEASALPSHAPGEVLATETALLSMSLRVPVGVVGVIAPSNAPFKLAIRSVAPALALGNAVILKPDPRTAVSGGVVFARIFEEAGLPSGVLHVVPGGGDVGSAMVTNPNVQAVSFTGSTKAGQSVGELAARNFTRAHLELGGNSALIVMADADLDRTVAAATRGSFFNSGQGCMVIGRHLVHDSIYDEYFEKLVASAEDLTVGNPATADVDLGPIIDEHQRDRIHSLVTDSAAAGATLRTDGTYDGLFYRPTVLADARPGMPACDDEVFGPVAPINRFATPDEAVDLASDSDTGSISAL
jgi:benzaldehyde dehydrogenase (NAD)